jgi:hypothetical protein
MRLFSIVLAIVACAVITVGRPARTVAVTTPAWELTAATKILAGMENKSFFRVAAWIELPNSCYNSRILRTVPTDSKSPGFFVQRQWVQGAICPMNAKNILPIDCVLVSTPFDFPRSRIIVASRGKSATTPVIWHVTIGPTPPPAVASCPHH